MLKYSTKRKTPTKHEFKYLSRSGFILNLYNEISRISSSLAKMIDKKKKEEDYSIESKYFSKSYEEIMHYYSKFNSIVIKDYEINRKIDKLISISANLKDIKESINIKNIESLKKEFRENTDEIISNFKEISYRLNEYGVMMWI